MWLLSALTSPGRRHVLGRSPGPRADRYLRLTTVLEDRGLQGSVQCVIAAITAAFGAIPLMMLASPAVPRGAFDRVLAVATAAGCLVLAVGWLRRRWPTKVESAVFVVVGAALIATSAVVPADPDVGMLDVTAASALLTGYATSFHGVRLVLSTWTVTAAALVVLVLRLAAVDPVLAIRSAAIVAVINVAVAITSRMAVRLILAEHSADDVHPLTGLLTSAGFHAKAATLLGARERATDRHLVLVVLTVDGYSAITTMSGRSGGLRAQLDVGAALRSSVRRDAVVAHPSDAEFFIADVFATADASPLVERVRGAVAGMPSRLTLSAGVVSTPLPPLRALPADEVLDEIISVATSAMYAARRTGGDAARYEINPRLTTGGGFGSDTP